MKLHINPILHFDSNEREIVTEALRPYRVLTGESRVGNEDAKEYTKAINRASGELRLEWLMDIHRKLLELQKALREDGEHWAKEQDTAPEDASGLIAKPRQVCQMLTEIRHRQADLAERAVFIVRNAMGILQSVTLDCKQMAGTVQRNDSTTSRAALGEWGSSESPWTRPPSLTSPVSWPVPLPLLVGVVSGH
jgi:hypothetical protein